MESSLYSNFLKITVRSLLRSKLYTFISIGGLLAGLLVSLVTFVYLFDQWSYDRFYDRSDRIHRLAVERIYPQRRVSYAAAPSGFAQVLEREVPGVEAAVRLWKPGEPVVVSRLGSANPERIGNGTSTRFIEEGMMLADSTFFRVFSIPLLQGDPATVLNQPNAMVITESAARKYFGTTNAVGQQLQTDLGDFVIRGICADLPIQSHFNFTCLGAWSSGRQLVVDEPNFMFFNAYTYLLLTPNASAAGVEARLPYVVKKHAAAHIQRQLGISYGQYTAAGNGYRYFLQPLTSIHLHSHLEGELGVNLQVVYVYLLLAAAGLLLLIAVINFINLATVRSASRAREVGIRKVLGAGPGQLRVQFLAEAVLICMTSGLLALLTGRIILPFFSQWIGQGFASGSSQWGVLTLAMIGACLLLGLVSGLYPAFVMSRFSPWQVLKGKFKYSAQGKWLRNGLVTGQFFISMSLLMGMLIILRQVDFMRRGNLGFSKEQVMVIERIEQLTDSVSDRRPVLIQRLQSLAGVVSVSASNPVPGEPSFGYQFMAAGEKEVFTCRGMMMDENLLATLGIKLTEGRNFSPQFTDTYSLLINQTAARELGMTHPVGQRLQMIHQSDSTRNQMYTIIGVMEDFHFQSMHEPVSALLALHTSNPNAYTPFVSVKIKATNPSVIVDKIRHVWQTLETDQPFSYFFLEQHWDRLYRQEQIWGQLFAAFGLITLVLACAGLFGLSAFLMQQRQKEVSLRKIMGAGLPNLFFLLGKNFLQLLSLAATGSIIFTHLAMGQWLGGFAYRISIGVDIYLTVILVTFLTGFGASCYHLTKVVFINPVQALKED
jgi:putative ABC transport system permease protein